MSRAEESSSRPLVRYNATTQLPLPAEFTPSVLHRPPHPDDDSGGDGSSDPDTLPLSPRIINGIPTPQNWYWDVASFLQTNLYEHVCRGMLIVLDLSLLSL